MSENLPPPEEIDPGPPIAEIAALADEPPSGFVPRIRGAIERRIAAGQLLDFALPAVLSFLKEIGSLLFGLPERPEPAPEANEDE